MAEPSSAAVDALRTVKLDLAASEVVEELRAQGIASIVLRGPAIARWLYPGEGRPYRDVDLLVPPEGLEPAERTMRALGFAGSSAVSSEFDRPSHESVWLRDADGTRVELHSSLDGVATDHATLWRVLAGETEELDLGLGEFRAPVLRLPARALVVALHAAQHGKAMPWPAADLERALAVLPAEDWAKAAEVARSIDAVPALAVGLRMTPAGREIADRLGLGDERPVDVELRRVDAPPMALAFDWLGKLPGFRAKATFVARELFPPVEYMRTRSLLARRGPAGLAAAYVWRPLSVAGRAPRAFVAWRRAR